MQQVVIFFNDSEVHPSGINAGGGESATLALAKAIKAAGWNVYACGFLPEGDTVVDGITFWDFGPDFRVDKLIPRLKNIGNFHCLSSSIVHPFLLMRELENCISKVIINHSPSETVSGIMPKTVFNIIDRMICVSDAQRKMFESQAPGFNKTNVIKNGFDPELFTYAGPENRDFSHFIFVGRVEIWKGAHLIIDIFPVLKKHFPNLKVSLFGSYEGWDAMIEIKKRMQTEQPDLRFMGKVSQTEIAAQMRSAGLLLFPSICFESAGLAVLDAQASGCPVVAFDQGGVKEYLLNGECGILQVDQSPKAFSETLYDLLSHPEKLATFSRNCIGRARKRTWSVVAREVIAVFNHIELGTVATTVSTKSDDFSINHQVSKSSMLDTLLSLPAIYRSNNFESFSIDQLLIDHQTIAEGKEVDSKLVEKAFLENPNNPTVAFWYALQLEKSGKSNDAISKYLLATQGASTTDWQPFFCSTLLLAELGKLKEAAINAKQVISRVENFPMSELLQKIISAAGD